MRQPKGFTLLEMLCVLFIISFVGVGMAEMAVTQNVVAFRAYNKAAGLINARKLGVMLERDIHNARFIGNQGGAPGYDQYISSAMTLNQQTLIVQIPVYQSSVPVMTSSNAWDVDTYVYQLKPDPDKAGQYQLQRSYYPGVTSDPTKAFTGEVVMSGIVGPFNPNSSNPGIPAVFSYVTRNAPFYSPLGAGTVLKENIGPLAKEIYGVVINLETKNDTESSRSDYIPRTIAFRQEYYVRANDSITQ